MHVVVHLYTVSEPKKKYYGSDPSNKKVTVEVAQVTTWHLYMYYTVEFACNE
jgi:hypothetical protein